MTDSSALWTARHLATFPAVGRWFSALVWEPRDLWIGVYWTREAGQLILYVCVVPTLVWKVVRDGK